MLGVHAYSRPGAASNREAKIMRKPTITQTQAAYFCVASAYSTAFVQHHWDLCYGVVAFVYAVLALRKH